MVKSENLTVLEKFEAREPFWHIAFWVTYLLFPFLKSIGRSSSFHIYSELNDLLFGMIVFYVTYLLFLPSHKKPRYVIFLLALFCAVGYVNLKAHNFLFEGTHSANFFSYYAIGYLSTYTMISLFAYVLYSGKDSYKKQVAIELAHSQKHQAELNVLKSQINPHFLFNTLNAIYSGALKKDDKTPDLILKLSDNFRYVLHEGQNDSVTIEKEVAHLKDYISLQKERLNDKVKVELTLDVDNYKKEIAPLLLISFVENSFKYASILRGSEHVIKIKIDLRYNAFSFSCENPFKERAEEEIDDQWGESGVGIAITKKRLEYLYPERHNLHIENEKDLFIVKLEIQL